MNNFIPSGFKTMRTANEEAALAWNGKELLTWSEIRTANVEQKKIKQRALDHRREGRELTEQEGKSLEATTSFDQECYRIALVKIYAETWKRLREALYSDVLPFSLQTEHHGTIKVKSLIWGSKAANFPPEKIMAEHIAHDRKYFGFVEGTPIVADEELSAFLTGQKREFVITNEPENSESFSSTFKTNKGGAPKKYSEAKFITEAAKLIYEGEEFKNQAELRRKALLAYAELSGETPSEDWAKRLIRDFWARLELG